MTREDIIRMAREADFGDGIVEFIGVQKFERFAALVASAERERIKQANDPEIERVNAYIKELEDAVTAEREACAKVCEEIGKKYHTPKYETEWQTIECAAAIRARAHVYANDTLSERVDIKGENEHD